MVPPLQARDLLVVLNRGGWYRMYAWDILRSHTWEVYVKTTVVVDDDLMRSAMKAARVTTKREAIELGLRELVKKRNVAALRDELGTYDLALDLDELKKLRNGR